MASYAFVLSAAVCCAMGASAWGQSVPQPVPPPPATVTFHTGPEGGAEFALLDTDGRQLVACVADPGGACTVFVPLREYLCAVRSAGRAVMFRVDVPHGGVSFVFSPSTMQFVRQDPRDAPAVWTPPPRYDPRATRPEIGVAGNAVFLTGSAYGHMIGLWGFRFPALEQLAVRAVARVDGRWVLGARLAYTGGSGGSANADGAGLSMHDYEIGGIAGFVFEGGRTNRFWRAGAELEGGVALLFVDLRGGEDFSLSPRFAIAGVVGFGVHPRAPRFTLRGGFQYLPYGAAGAGSADPAFTGIFFGLGLDELL